MTHGGAQVQHESNSWKSQIESLTLWLASINSEAFEFWIQFSIFIWSTA